MPYSCKLIPYKGLKIKVDVDFLLEKFDFSIARRIDMPLENSGIDFSSGVPIIPMNAPFLGDFYHRIPSMSMTLVNCIEICEAASYKLYEPASKNWNGENIDFSNYENSIEKLENCFQIIYGARNLHKQTVPYVRKFQKKSEMLDSTIQGVFDEEFDKNKVYNVNGLIYLEHSPTNLNYLHFELKLQDSEGKIVKSSGISSYSESDKNQTSKSGRDCFTRYVLRNFLTKDFNINEIPEDANSLSEEVFIDASIPNEERKKNKALTEHNFQLTKLEKETDSSI